MKIYVASKFERKDEVREVQAFLRDNGHEISSDWTQHDYSDVPKEEQPAFLRKCAMEDLFGVIEADMLILMPDKTAGAHFTELGIALGLCIPIIVLGHKPDEHARNIFYNLSCLVFCNTVDEVLAQIREFEKYAAEHLRKPIKKGDPIIDIT